MSGANAQLKDSQLALTGDWLRGAPHPEADDFLQQHQMVATWKLNADNLGKWDSTLLVFLSKICAHAEVKGFAVDFSALPDGLAKLLKLGEYGRKHTPVRTNDATPKSLFVKAGEFGIEIRDTVIEIVDFIGALALSLWHLVTFRSKMRWTDFREQLFACGPKAMPITSLISFLMGLILAFVGSIPLKWFQAQQYVASLVGIGMLRLMAPTMVGVVMAGRTSASYAAELGTMQVNEELDAMQTLGIPHTDFLVLPRFLAMSLMLPVLTIFADITSIVGGLLVAMFDMGLTPHAYIYTLLTTTRLSDLIVGLITCFVLGILDACCGCYQGMHCGRSAAAVGRVTTAAVVYSIVCIVLATSLITVITVILKV